MSANGVKSNHLPFISSILAMEESLDKGIHLPAPYRHLNPIACKEETDRKPSSGRAGSTHAVSPRILTFDGHNLEFFGFPAVVTEPGNTQH